MPAAFCGPGGSTQPPDANCCATESSFARLAGAPYAGFVGVASAASCSSCAIACAARLHGRERVVVTADPLEHGECGAPERPPDRTGAVEGLLVQIDRAVERRRVHRRGVRGLQREHLRETGERVLAF